MPFLPMKKCPSNELSKSSRHGSEPATERIHRKARRKSAVDNWRREQRLKRTPFEGRMKMRKEGKAQSTQAGEFVREEIHHAREGKHGARISQASHCHSTF
jgi:hypothetical protein